MESSSKILENRTARVRGRVRRGDRPRRILNVMVASIGLILTAPLMLAIAIAIKLTSPGPVIYRQQRVGLDRRNRTDLHRPGCRRDGVDSGGRIFTIYKFRTMRIEDGDARQQWARPDDPRVTPIGRILRKTRLDELPQFVNVLKGDMNIVGPRPEQPEIFLELRDELPSYRLRQRVLPGITGLAQVNQGYDRDLDDVKRKLNYDIRYVESGSPLLDLWVMLKTLPVMIFKIGSQ
jgi:lipopolysaccharide/colanic/teichoic acid biosynthesis glycosyltransferase